MMMMMILIMMNATRLLIGAYSESIFFNHTRTQLTYTAISLILVLHHLCVLVFSTAFDDIQMNTKRWP